MWSFGITLFELVMGEPPNSNAVASKAMQLAIGGSITQLDEKFSKHFRDMYVICLTQDPAKRPSAEELSKHKLVKGAKKKKWFLSERITEFIAWRTRGGGDSDSEESSGS